MMTAFVPIPPRQAAAMLEPIASGDAAKTVLSDYVAAGPIKAYARLIATIHADGTEHEVRDKRIDRKLWRRIATDGAMDVVFTTGSVRLEGQGDATPAVNIVGIRLNEDNVRTVVEQHGSDVTTSPVVPVQDVEAPVTPLVPAVRTIPAASVVETATPLPKPTPRERPVGGIKPGQVSASVNEACVALGIGKTTLYKKFDDGSLPMSKIGGRTVIPVAGIYRLLGVDPDQTA